MVFESLLDGKATARKITVFVWESYVEKRLFWKNKIELWTKASLLTIQLKKI